MSIEEFGLYLVSNIAKESDLVRVKMFTAEDANILEILVSESDMPRVIGRQGAVASSIKTLIQAKAYNDGVKSLKINIDSF